RALTSPLFPYTTLFRSIGVDQDNVGQRPSAKLQRGGQQKYTPNAVRESWSKPKQRSRWKGSAVVSTAPVGVPPTGRQHAPEGTQDRKSTRLNSSHQIIS